MKAAGKSNAKSPIVDSATLLKVATIVQVLAIGVSSRCDLCPALLKLNFPKQIVRCDQLCAASPLRYLHTTTIGVEDPLSLRGHRTLLSQFAPAAIEQGQD